MVGQETVSERIEKLVDHLNNERFWEDYKIREFCEELLGKNKIDYIYPKNILEKVPSAEEVERVDSLSRVYYVFHGDFFSEVIKSSKSTLVETYPLEVKSFKYARPEEGARRDVSLEVAIESYGVIQLDSSSDSNDPWMPAFTKLIQEIHAHLLDL